MNNNTVIFFLVGWLMFTTTNLVISWIAPSEEVLAAAKITNEANEPKRQNEFLYAEVVSKIDTCKSKDVDGVLFFYCPDNSVITKTNWTRNQGERKGVVTRYYDSTGKLLLIYGHPDDV